jgi:hypothetical protein
MKFLNKYPSVKLLSGVRVVNYSSPHPYRFHTGEELPACSDEVAQDTKLVADHGREKNDKGWYDISINYSLSEMQEEELLKLAILNEIDIILVPYPVLKAIIDIDWNESIDAAYEKGGFKPLRLKQVRDKVRVCKLHDRVTKVIRSDEFCV